MRLDEPGAGRKEGEMGRKGGERRGGEQKYNQTECKGCACARVKKKNLNQYF